MQSIKSLIVITVLAAVAYGVYVTVNKKPAPPPPPGADEQWAEAPAVEIPGGPNEAAPAYDPASADTAQAYPPAANSGDAPLASTPAELPPDASAAQAPTYAADQTQPNAQGLPGDAQGAMPASANEPQSYDPAAGALPTADAATVPQDPTAGAEAPVDFQALMADINLALEQGQLAEAQMELSRWFDDPRLNEQDQQDLLSLLDRVTGTVIYSRQHLLEQPYEVQPGDTLERIATMYDVPWQLLAKINGVADPMRLKIGDQLKVVRGPFSAYVELEKHRLTLWADGRYAGRFPIGIGKDGSTPEGEFAVLKKIENPTYYGPDGTIDSEDPNNPLGEFWIDLGNSIGIHGTNDESSIGRDESRGCIRLSPRDIEDVYDMLTEKSRVLIRR